MIERIKEIAKEKGISVNTLEKKAGLQRGYLFHLKGTPRSVQYAKKTADVLGVTVDELLKNEKFE